MKKRSQVSVEFIMIFALAMMILIPAAYFFRNFVLESSDRILISRVDEIANSILTKADKIYAYGPPSKTTLEINMPSQISRMYIKYIEGEEYYLVFTILASNGEQDLLYESAVPIIAGQDIGCAADLCTETGVTCECMPPNYYRQGLKFIGILAEEDAGSSYISIKEVSGDVAN